MDRNYETVQCEKVRKTEVRRRETELGSAKLEEKDGRPMTGDGSRKKYINLKSARIIISLPFRLKTA